MLDRIPGSIRHAETRADDGPFMVGQRDRCTAIHPVAVDERHGRCVPGRLSRMREVRWGDAYLADQARRHRRATGQVTPQRLAVPGRKCNLYLR
jgi:hypothetical protein